jgi:hypothetical protein
VVFNVTPDTGVPPHDIAVVVVAYFILKGQSRYTYTREKFIFNTVSEDVMSCQAIGMCSSCEMSYGHVLQDNSY